MIGSTLVILALLAAPVGGPLPPGAETLGSREFVTVGDWMDAVKTDSGRVSRRVRAVVDRSSGLTHHFVSGSKGDLIEHVVRQRGNRPSDREIEVALSIARRDPTIRRELAQGYTLDGGFLLEEPRGERCDLGSRCLQVFVFDLIGKRVVHHMIVDLATSSIAYPTYIPYRNR